MEYCERSNLWGKLGTTTRSEPFLLGTSKRRCVHGASPAYLVSLPEDAPNNRQGSDRRVERIVSSNAICIVSRARRAVTAEESKHAAACMLENFAD
jgi:hypothetical protein